MKYFIVESQEIYAMCDEMHEYESQTIKKALNLSRKYNGSRRLVAYNHNYTGDIKITGFIFKNEAKVDDKIFRKFENADNVWIPRKTNKIGKHILKQFESWRSDHRRKLYDKLKYDTISFQGAAFYISHLRFYKIKNNWYICVPRDGTIQGCKRVSDLVFEHLLTESEDIQIGY